MLLMSKSQDYYDKCQWMDKERKPVYHRIKRELELSSYTRGKGWETRKESIDLLGKIYSAQASLPMKGHLLLFCGIILPYWKERRTTDGKEILYLTLDSLYQSKAIHKAWDAWAAANHNLNGMHLHRHYKSPILLVSGGRDYMRLTIDPSLQEIGFNEDVMSSTYVWQEIDMFLSRLEQERLESPPARTQELIRDAHGFDKHSFIG